jgi:hypothetical protein
VDKSVGTSTSAVSGSIGWKFWSGVLGAVLDGAGIVDSEVLQTVRNEYYEELREMGVALDVGANLLVLVFAH